MSLDKFESPIMAAEAGEVGGMSDMILSAMLAERTKVNLPAKAASLIRSDANGVGYLPGCRYPNDFDEMNSAILGKVIDACVSSAEYGCIVIDGDLSSQLISDFILSNTDDLVLVSESGPRAAQW